MKNRVYFATIAVFLLAIPAMAFSAPSLAKRLQGRILLAVEDKGKTYYVAPDGNRYRITATTAHKIFEKLALGITNKDLEDIPLKDVGVDSEARVAGDAVKVVEKIVYRDRIMYVDKPAQCETQYDSTFYINQIEQLQREVASLKEQNQSLPIPDTSAKDLLNKTYGLKINALKSELIELDEMGRYKEDIYNSYLSKQYDYKLWHIWNTDFKAQMLSKIWVALDSGKYPIRDHTRKGLVDFLAEQNVDRNNEILLLQNELERKLLEVE